MVTFYGVPPPSQARAGSGFPLQSFLLTHSNSTKIHQPANKGIIHHHSQNAQQQKRISAIIPNAAERITECRSEGELCDVEPTRWC
ncbi:MAG: hypothetical protein LBQ31_00940 [Bacteroidales bacterium]|nr:hypothetical protein [Bacteroidales bacterium]